MPVANGTEPISDDELLYRRIPVSQGWYNPDMTHPLSPKAFRPQRHDLTGLSVSRAKYRTVQDAAQGREGKSYYVAVLRAGDLRSHCIRVEPRPREGDLGHSELPDMTYDTRDSDQVHNWTVTLAHQLCLRVEGPFGPSWAIGE
jgi:hypothetical protein